MKYNSGRMTEGSSGLIRPGGYFSLEICCFTHFIGCKSGPKRLISSWMAGLYPSVLKLKFGFRKYQIIGWDTPEVTVTCQLLEFNSNSLSPHFDSDASLAEEQFTQTCFILNHESERHLRSCSDALFYKCESRFGKQLNCPVSTNAPAPYSLNVIQLAHPSWCKRRAVSLLDTQALRPL